MSFAWKHERKSTLFLLTLAYFKFNIVNVQTYPSAATVARSLTSQVMDRQFPVITSSAVHRDFLYRLSQIPWTEQRMVKQSFDSNFTPKKVKRIEKPATDLNLKNTTLPGKLYLKQVGKSVKYARNKVRNNVKKENLEELEGGVTGQLSGEWEKDHSFLCSVCGIEYDDVLEIMHHKWEAHPHCLVAHVSLRQNLQRPPALLYPQVGIPRYIQYLSSYGSVLFLALGYDPGSGWIYGSGQCH